MCNLLNLMGFLRCLTKAVSSSSDEVSMVSGPSMGSCLILVATLVQMSSASSSSPCSVISEEWSHGGVHLVHDTSSACAGGGWLVPALMVTSGAVPLEALILPGPFAVHLGDCVNPAINPPW